MQVSSNDMPRDFPSKGLSSYGSSNTVPDLSTRNRQVGNFNDLLLQKVVSTLPNGKGYWLWNCDVSEYVARTIFRITNQRRAESNFKDQILRDKKTLSEIAASLKEGYLSNSSLSLVYTRGDLYSFGGALRAYLDKLKLKESTATEPINNFLSKQCDNLNRAIDLNELDVTRKLAELKDVPKDSTYFSKQTTELKARIFYYLNNFKNDQRKKLAQLPQTEQKKVLDAIETLEKVLNETDDLSNLGDRFYTDICPNFNTVIFYDYKLNEEDFLAAINKLQGTQAKIADLLPLAGKDDEVIELRLTDIPNKNGNNFWQNAKIVIPKNSELDYKTLMNILTAMDKLPDHIRTLMSNGNITIFIKDKVPSDVKDKSIKEHGFEPAGTMNMETLEMTLYLEHTGSDPRGVIWHESGHGVHAFMEKAHFLMHVKNSPLSKFLDGLKERRVLGIRAYLAEEWDLNLSQIDEFLAGKEITGCLSFPKLGTTQREKLEYYLSFKELLAEELDKSIEEIYGLEPEKSKRREIIKYFTELHDFYKKSIIENPDLIELIEHANELKATCKREFDQLNIRDLIEKKRCSIS